MLYQNMFLVVPPVWQLPNVSIVPILFYWELPGGGACLFKIYLMDGLLPQSFVRIKSVHFHISCTERLMQMSSF